MLRRALLRVLAALRVCRSVSNLHSRLLAGKRRAAITHSAANLVAVLLQRVLARCNSGGALQWRSALQRRENGEEDRTNSN